MGVTEFKIFSIIVVFLSGIGGGLLSLRWGMSRRAEILFSLGNALAGGIFLGAGLIHMLPDAAEGFHKVMPGFDYPLPLLLCAAGFLLILFLEQILLKGHEPESAEGQTESRMFLPYVLTFVLSVHSILAGAALGAEDTLAGSVILFIAIIGHKASAAFALAVNLLRGKMAGAKVFNILLFFSTMTPLGIFLGSLLCSLLAMRPGEILEAVFDSLAAGTFLYIAALEVIREEFFLGKRRWPKFGLLCIGLAFMAVLALYL
jgi:zinc transporter 1/2/3